MVQTVEKWGSVLKLLDHVFNRNCRPSVGEILGTKIFRDESGHFYTTQATLTQQMTPILVNKYKPINSDKFTKYVCLLQF